MLLFLSAQPWHRRLDEGCLNYKCKQLFCHFVLMFGAETSNTPFWPRGGGDAQGNDPDASGLNIGCGKTAQRFEKFISTIHKLYNTAHICLLWKSKSKVWIYKLRQMKKQSITFELKKRKYNTIWYRTNIVPRKSISQYKTSNTNGVGGVGWGINIHKTSWANNVWYRFFTW